MASKRDKRVSLRRNRREQRTRKEKRTRDKSVNTQAKEGLNPFRQEQLTNLRTKLREAKNMLEIEDKSWYKMTLEMEGV